MAGEDLPIRDVPFGPMDLGLPEPPAPPALPAMGAAPLDFKAKLLRLIAAGVAGGLGPGAGTGILQGANVADQLKAREQQQKDQQARSLYQEQQHQYEAQQRLYEQEAQRRRVALDTNVRELRRIAPTLKNKAEFDAFVDEFANGLAMYGIRNPSIQLRQRVRYTAPTAKDLAAAQIEAFLKNPVNKSMLEEHPEELPKQFLRFDRDGDGEPEDVPWDEALLIAEMPVARGPDGDLLVYPKDTKAADKANADGILASLLEQAKAEGKAITPQLKMQLQQQAITKAKEAGDLGPDPTLDAIRQLTLAQAKNAPKQTYPQNVQKRLDALSKGFDAQQGVKRIQVVAEAVSFVNSLPNDTDSAADDQALIYAFAKAMDPDSVVREGEYATVQKYAQEWAATFGFNVARIFTSGPFLTQQARRNMKQTIRAKFNAGRGQYENLRKSYSGRIDRITGQPGSGELELTDYGGAFPAEPTVQAPTADSAREKYRQRQGVK